MKKRYSRIYLHLAGLALATLFLPAPAPAVVSYHFDFGLTPYNGVDGGPAGLTLNMGDWVTVSSLNSFATNGLSLEFGRGTGGTGNPTTVSWGSDVSTATNSFGGVLGLSSLYGDGLGGSPGPNQAGIIGLRLAGLPDGEYDVFATLFIETPADLSSSTTAAWLGTGDATIATVAGLTEAVNRPWNGFCSTATNFVSESGCWNYISNRVSVVQGQYVLLMGQLPFASGNALYEPIISTLQIVAIPEPSSWWLASLGLVLLAWRRKL